MYIRRQCMEDGARFQRSSVRNAEKHHDRAREERLTGEEYH